ncbi:MAG: glycosyltransferase family 2 protein [Alphaproteobacteria bacterium]|nr:glycosyltransferase family 2 protein [Alphaproteobacteria bacterium]
MTTLHPELIRKDARLPGEDKSEIRLFIVLRDEMLRLPFFLDYYRKLGVSRFFAIDNSSVDGSGDFLLAQDDCHVFFTAGSYGASRCGVTWLNSLLDLYGSGHWIVLADTDELLVYPDSEKKLLPHFCSWLDSRDDEALYALLLDMYSSQPIREVNYKAGEDFRLLCNYHDGHYAEVRRFGYPSAFPPFEHIGGPRLRLCFPEQNTPALWPRLKVKLARRVLALAGLPAPVVATQAYKVPLVRWKAGNAFINSHRLNAVRLSPVTGAMLHFKYFQDFGHRVEEALSHGEHYAGGVEYRRYSDLLAQNPDLTLADADSVPYRSSADLVARGLIRVHADWSAR